MSEAEIIKDFNNVLKSFLSFLNSNSKDDDIAYYYNMIDSLLLMDATKFIEQYVINILPYNNEIENKNINFFLNLNMDDKLNNQKSHILKALKLKNMFKILDSDKQEIIFDYLILLSEYGAMFFKQKYNK